MPTLDYAAFARAKIQQPRLRIEQLERPALEQRLEHALGARALVLVSAPAGYGKTVLVSRVLGRCALRHAVAWVSADEDDDLQRLVHALVIALEPYDLPWRMAPEALGTLAAAGQRQSLDVLHDALAGAEIGRGVIVIEDAHRLGDPSIFEWLDRLVERLPANWSVALTSRVDPPLSLARLRARGELAEFRAEDLRFSRDEAEALAATLAPEAGQRVVALWQRTHGWPAGLHLALRAGTAGSGWSGDRHTFDYLASEVLADMPPGLQVFLQRCAVLPELTAGRCAAVSGDGEAVHWLDEIERRALFVTALESGERTLRLHDLFRDFLEERLQRYHAAELPALLRRAAESEPDPVRKVGYLLRAGDLAAAERALASAAPVMLLEGAAAQVLRLIELFPGARRESSATLAYAHGLCAWPNFDWVTLQRTMRMAADGFERSGETAQALQARAFETMALLNLGRLDEAAVRLAALPPHPDDPELGAFAELLRYWDSGARGPMEGPARHLSRMIDRLEQHPSAELWLRCLPHFLFLGHPGVSAQMARYVAHALALAGETHPQLRAGANTLKAWLAMWDARLDDAEALLREAEADAEWLGRPNNLHHAITVVHGVIHGLRAEREARDEAVRTLAAVDTDGERRRTWQGIYLYQVSRWYLVSDDWSAIGMLRGQLNAKSTDGEWPYVAVARAALNGLWALNEDDSSGALEIIAPWLDAADRYDITATRSNVRLTAALAMARLGRLAEAWDTAAPAIALSRQPGEKLSLMLCGAAMLRAFADQPWGALAPAEDLAWVRSLAELGLALRRAAPAPAAGVRTTLSERECEVLDHIAAGHSNKLIARALALSPHTVKRHVANILTKLGLETRGQAAAWWHAQHNADPPRVPVIP